MKSADLYRRRAVQIHREMQVEIIWRAKWGPKLTIFRSSSVAKQIAGDLYRATVDTSYSNSGECGALIAFMNAPESPSSQSA